MSRRNPFLALILIAAAGLCLPSIAHAAKEKFQRDKPHVNIGVIAGDALDLRGFDALSGLGVDIEVLEVPGSDRKRPGRVKWSGITLERGYFADPSVRDWATEGLTGDVSLRSLRIDLLSRSAEPLQSFELVECFPTKWEISINEEGRAVETLALKCDRVDLR